MVILHMQSAENCVNYKIMLVQLFRVIISYVYNLFINKHILFTLPSDIVQVLNYLNVDCIIYYI